MSNDSNRLGYEIVNLIKQAFSEWDRRAVDYRMVIENEHSQAASRRYVNKTWEEIPSTLFLKDVQDVFALADGAVRYLLPALMVACIEVDETGDLGSNLLFRLFEHYPRIGLAKHLGPFSNAQHAAFVMYLRWELARDNREEEGPISIYMRSACCPDC